MGPGACHHTDLPVPCRPDRPRPPEGETEAREALWHGEPTHPAKQHPKWGEPTNACPVCWVLRLSPRGQLTPMTRAGSFQEQGGKREVKRWGRGEEKLLSGRGGKRRAWRIIIGPSALHTPLLLCPHRQPQNPKLYLEKPPSPPLSRPPLPAMGSQGHHAAGCTSAPSGAGQAPAPASCISASLPWHLSSVGLP